MLSFFLQIGIIILALLLLLIYLRIKLIKQVKRLIINPSAIIPYQTAIVFGAGINKAGFPTKVLIDRLETTIQLFNQRKLQKILISGGKAKNTSEAIIMQNYLIDHGIPKEILLKDEEGFSTFDTLKRAKEIFQIQQAILITQKFHLPRAIGIAEMLHMDVVGVTADRRRYKITSLIWWNLRELFAWLRVIYRMKRSGT